MSFNTKFALGAAGTVAGLVVLQRIVKLLGGNPENVTGSKDQFVIMSSNLFGGAGQISGVETLEKFFVYLKPDAVCIQECPIGFIDIEGYRYDNTFPKDILPADYLTLYTKDKPQWTIIGKETLYSHHCHTKRISDIYTFQKGTKRIRVANVHLCGGKFDEDFKNGCKEDHCENTLRKGKLEMLQRITDLKPSVDIIAGDFNSDLLAGKIGKDTPPTSQVTFLRSKNPPWTDAEINAWNSPTEFLASKGFAYVTIKSDQVRPTSFYRITTDGIFYNTKRLSAPTSTSQFNMYGETPTSGASDHDAIFARFEV